jgi:hypothetical protein
MPEKGTPRAYVDELKRTLSLDLVQTYLPCTPPLLGKHIMDLEYQITNAAFRIPPETEAVLDIPSSEPFILHLCSTDESEVTVRRLAPLKPVR